MLRRSGKPVVLAANKVDDAPGEADAGCCGRSASASRTRSARCTAAAAATCSTPSSTRCRRRRRSVRHEAGPRRVALIGRPNVGKSSLLNRLAGEERVLVDSVAGTTRDPVDELIELGGKTWRFVDTAGIRRRCTRRRARTTSPALRTERALERAEVAVVLIDASEPLTEQDLRIISMVIDAGRALVIAFNKWDLLDEDRRDSLEREIDRELYTSRWAPRVNVSAATGRHVDRLSRPWRRR